MLGEEEVGVLDVLRIRPHDCEGPMEMKMSKRKAEWERGCYGECFDGIRDASS
jgi:hypothetical protein